MVRKLVIAWVFAAAVLNTNGQNTLDNVGLDASNPAAAAYSLRQLSSAYSGPAVQVRRSSDNTTQNIGFDGSGNLDQAALLTFVGAGNGFITVYYDQSGFGRNAIQATQANQPRIVNAGVVETQNGRPAIYLNGSTYYLTQSTLSVSTPYTANVVVSRTASNGGYQRLINFSSTGDFYGFIGASVGNYATFAGSGTSWNDVAANSPATPVGASSVIMTMTVNAGAGGLIPYLNGTAVGSKNGTAGTSTGFQIGSPYNGSNLSQLWTGYLSEFIVFPSSLAVGDRQTLENNQTCYYTLPPSITLGIIASIPASSVSASLPYTFVSPNTSTYSITWSPASSAAGFADVADAALPASPITITVPAGTTAGSIYTGSLTVKNSCGTSSASYPVSIQILNPVLGTSLTAQAAYSTRRVCNDYLGNAIRVRRSSDNATQDIGFTAGGDLDQAALLTFVGASSGYVVTWYDQSGNSRDATQNTAARQPRIVNAGVVDLAGIHPGLTLTGGQTMLTSLTIAQAVGAGITATISSVFQANSAVNQSLISGNGNEYNIHAPWSDGNTYFDISNSGTGRISGALNWSSLAIGSFVRNGAQADVYKNGINSITSSSRNTSFTFTNNFINLFAYSGNSYYMQGIVPEMILFSSALSSADRQSIEANQNCYYSVPPTITLGLIPGIPANSTTASLPYTSTTLNPTTYSIAWNAAALTAGFADVVDAALPASPIAITIPAGTAAGSIYSGSLAVKTFCGVASVAYPISVQILNPVLGTSMAAQAAYSVRKVCSAYTGNAIRVRRNSDNATQDIGFTAGGDMDQAALLTFVGASSGYVVTWYDQSGNGRDATQNTAARQPRIVNAGVVDVVNARPVLTLSGGQTMLTALTIAQAVGAGITATISSVFQGNSGVNQSLVCGNVNEYNIHAPWSDGNTYFDISNAGTGRLSGGLTWSSLSIASFVRNGAQADVFKNGINSLTSSTRNTSFTFSNNYINLFVQTGTSNYMQGLVPELILFSSALSTADRQTIEANQTCYYAVPPAITLSLIPGIPANSTSASLPYTSTTLNPTTYSIAWNAAALTAGFADVADAALPASPIALTVPPGTTPGGIYSGSLTVKTACGVSSVAYPISVQILNPVLGTSLSAQAAYSLRKVCSAYTGNAIRVRRSSDNATQDIGFTAGGDLDQAALLTFVGASNGFVLTWYDQSGNGRDATQNTAARQPRIVNAGVVDVVNARPVLSLTGGQTMQTGLTIAQAAGSGITASISSVFQGNSGVQQSLLSGNGSEYNIFAPWNDGNTYFDLSNSGTGRISGALTWSSLSVGSFVRNGAQADVYKNGLNSITSNSRNTSFTFTNNLIYLFAFSGTSYYMQGTVPEMILFSSALSTSDRLIIECSQGSYYSIAQNTDWIDFNIQGNSALTACNTVDEEVKWKYADLTNVQATGNNLIKTASNGAWNGGAASWNTVSNNGYFQFTATETNTYRMVGLSNTNPNSNYTTIQYAVYLRNDAVVEVYESGSSRGSFGSYAANDVFRVAVEANVVKYYRNGNLFYISGVSPTLPLLVDVSINSINGTVTNALVSNYNTGDFLASAANSGSVLNYQWKLNSSNVGSNSSAYNNPALNNNDVLNCILTTNIGGCIYNFNSNNLTNKSVLNPTSIDFMIQGTSASSACNTAEEQVKWKISDLVNTQITGSGNSLSKVQSNGNWNGGAASWNTVANNGYLQFIATEINTARMVGLSNTNTNSNFNTIQFAVYLRADALIEIYESGASRGAFGSYTANDVFRISIEAGVVKYYRNGSLFYISGVAPTLPMLVDVSIRDVNGTVTKAIVSNYNTGSITATATNAGASPTYQWKLNGANVGSNSSNYTNTALADNDTITCMLIPDLGGCSVNTYTSNIITNKFVPAPTGTDFYITGSVAASACNTAEEQVKWKISDLANTQTTGLGNSLSKVQSNGVWDGGAASWNTVGNNGYLQFTATETNTYRAVGLSTTNTNATQNSIQYAVYLQNNGTFNVYESGSNRGSFGSYSGGDVFRVSVEANVVKYYRNGNLIYISGVAPTLPLLVDVSIRDVNGTVTNAIVSNYNTGNLTATATNAGATPAYQWKLNGANVGSNSNSYTNTALADNDAITCIITPDLGGCFTSTYNSNTITNKFVPAPTGTDFYITGTSATFACNTIEEQVKWKISDLVNTQITGSGNSLNKLQSNGAWDGGAASWNTVANNGYFQFTATEINTYRMVGLSTSNANANYTSIQYAVYLLNNATVQIYESGALRGTFGSYATGDVFRVSVESNVVKYYRNGIIFYISGVSPTLPLLVDVSINNVNGTVTNAIVSNYNTGVLTATATNAGSTPTYQWKLNGANVGSNSSSYTNTALADNDAITCVLTPDLGGCFASTYTSNTITNKFVPAPVGTDFFITGTLVASACNTADEQVKWKISNLVNTQTTGLGNSLTKVLSNGVWDGGAASWNTVGNNGYLEFTATETNTYRAVGLSTTNTNANYTSIQYAIYLQNNGTFLIYESGAGRGNFGSYASGDVFRIAVEANVVKYYRNGSLLYISGVSPTLPLLVDVSIRDVNGTVTNAIVSNYNTGSLTATATNAGSSPTYQWKLNGAIVGTNSSSYTNTALADNDAITCVLTPDLGGCFVNTYNSNTITNKFVPAPTGTDFYITGTSATFACNTVEEQVKWKISDLTNTQITGLGNSLSKLQSNGAWDGGAASWNTVANNGYLQFTATEINTYRMVGLSNTNTNSNYNTIQYAVYLRADAVVEIYESGTSRGTFGSYTANDAFRISVEAGVVKYYRNGSLFYISGVSPTLPLLVDVSIYNVNGTVTNAIVSNYNTGVLTATATNAGAAPTYQWKLNGANVGSNSSSYTNTALADNDAITCVLTPDLGGCFTSTYSSNTITNKFVPAPVGTDFFITGTVVASACNTADEQVKWKISDLVNTQTTGLGNSLTKVLSNGTWNGGAASWNTVGNNGYLEFTATETNTYRAVGLSTTNANANYTSIQYAVYLQNNGTVIIYESGNSRGSFGSYLSGDVFRISVEASVVKYYRNGSLLYISGVSPTLPLLVDVSIYNVNGTVTNAIVSNYNTGSLTATATNAGTSPTYQWKLNGANVGSNSNSYSNTGLADNDAITCVLTPDLGGCFVNTYTSNTITNKFVPAPTGTDFFITGTPAASACITAEEQVKWKISDLVNTQITGSGNSLNKLQSNGTWNGGAASWNTVGNNGYLQFTATEINTARMAGLSTTNANADYTTIQYAIYLQNNGTFNVYESGNNRGSFGSYVSGDVFRVSVEANVVKYYRNGSFFYISGVSPTLPLLVDVSIRDVNGTVTNAIVSNYNVGTFIATATNAGSSPTYQWKLNGASVGSNSNSYSNTGLADNDAITCVLTPDLGGCYSSAYTSNSIINRIISTSVNIPVFALGATSNRCQGAGTVVYAATVTGQNVGFTDLVGVIASGHNLIKTAGSAWGNGGAASTNKINDNSFAYTIVSETNTSRYFGLSNTNTNAGNTTIQFAFSLINTGSLEVRESGTLRATGLTYATGDTLKIAVESGIVKYYKNSTLVYSSAVAPTLPLIVDVSIFTFYGTLNSINTDAVYSYSLDAASLTGGNTINSITGSVTYAAGWNGTTNVIASATGCNGTLTSTHSITINTPPAITGQPGNSTVLEGTNTSFSVTATGSGLTYQWQENPGSGWVNLADGGIYSTVTTATLNLTGVLASMNGYQYRCLISGTCSPGQTSLAAVLTVQPLTFYYARASGSWDALTTWSTVSGDGPAAASLPPAVAVVNIGNGAATGDRIVTIPLNRSVVCSALNIGGNGQNNSLVLSGGTSALTVSGDVLINTPALDGSNSLNIGDGTATISGSFSLNGNSTSTSRLASLLVANGSISIGGNLVLGDGTSANTAKVDLSAGAATLNLAGALTVGTAGALNPGTLSTFHFNGSATQNIVCSSVITFNNMVISNAAGVALNTTNAVTTDNLTINSGSVITIPPLGKLEVTSNLSNLAGNPGLVIQADATGSGSLLHSTAGVNASVQQYLTDNSATYFYHTNSSPVTNALASVYLISGAGPYLYSYNPASSTSKWINIKDVSTPLNPGTGYLINYKTRTTAETITFTGPLNTGNIDLSLTSDGDENNLIGNPYPCAIDWDAPSGWTFGNADNYITIWNPVDGSYGSYVRGVGIGTHGVTNIIPSGQGFFVRALSNTTIGMSNAVKIHDNSLIKSSTIAPVYFKIRVTNDTNSFNDEVVVYYNPDVSRDYDQGFEAKKVFSIMKESSQIFTQANDGTNLAINALPENDNDSIVLYFKCGIQANYTIHLVESNGLNLIRLTDLFGSNNEDLLSSEYKFSASPGDTSLRFILNAHLGKTGIKGVTAAASEEVVIKPTVNGLRLLNLASQPVHGCLTVNNLLGQTVYKEDVTLATELTRSGFYPGLYIVTFTSSENVAVKKILIR